MTRIWNLPSSGNPLYRETPYSGASAPAIAISRGSSSYFLQSDDIEDFGFAAVDGPQGQRSSISYSITNFGGTTS